MQKRIRYIKDGDLLRSARFIMTTNGEALVRINPASNTALITCGDNHVEVTGSSLHKVKIAAKKKLSEMGAVFEEEKRNVIIE